MATAPTASAHNARVSTLLRARGCPSIQPNSRFSGTPAFGYKTKMLGALQADWKSIIEIGHLRSINAAGKSY
jgi:hypothetical protein